MALQDEQAQVQDIQTHSSLLLDALFCAEDLPANATDDEDTHYWDSLRKNQSFLAFDLVENDPFWREGDSELESLISKQDQTHLSCSISDDYLIEARNEALSWVFSVQLHFAFSPLTSMLAVNYFDRFVPNVRLQRDKPWMSQLAAVACLSLAAKVEETHVPLLLDLQVRTNAFTFKFHTPTV